jgi:hypothetical protein
MAPPLGPHSKRSRLAVMDKRTQEASAFHKIRQELLDHCGPNPSVTQKALCERAAILTLYVKQFDAKAMLNGGLAMRETKEYLAYSNSLTRTLAALNTVPKPRRAKSAADQLNAHLDDLGADDE